MFKISLVVYKDTKYYFSLFDVLLKKVNINKDAFLKEAGISPSSYRKARTIEQNIGVKIISQLCDRFCYKNASNEFIEELEKFINEIYFNMYYKVYKTYEEDLKRLDELLNENYIVFPIILLIKLFMIANSHIESSAFIYENQKLFLELKKYSVFFNDDLLEIYDILSLFFENTLQEKLLLKEYKNGLIYYSLSSRLCAEKRFLECLFISKRAEEILVRERNYKRLLYLNIKVMYCLNAMHSYQECFELANMQLLALNSFVNIKFEYDNTIKHLVVSSLALKKYSVIENILESKQNISLTELCCLLIAKYHINLKEYANMYNYYLNMLKNENDRNAVICVNNYLKDNNQKELTKMENANVMYNFSWAIKMSEK